MRRKCSKVTWCTHPRDVRRSAVRKASSSEHCKVLMRKAMASPLQDKERDTQGHVRTQERTEREQEDNKWENTDI